MQVGTQRGLAGVRYAIDRAASRFTVRATATGLLSPFGHSPTIAIRDYDGAVQFIPGTYEKAFVQVTVKPETMEPVDEMKREDREKMTQLMRHEMLEVERFPSVVYESKSVQVQKLGDNLLQVNVSGELTLHGTTQRHSFDARVMELGTMLRISGTFALRQSDYGIKPVSFAAGTLRLKDELKFTFDIVARHVE
jgi:polyisoprenoid-binding protein YceI